MEENRRETYESFDRNVWPNLKKKMPKLALKKPQATKEQTAKAGHTLRTASNVAMEDKGQEEPGRTESGTVETRDRFSESRIEVSGRKFSTRGLAAFTSPPTTGFQGCSEPETCLPPVLPV